MNRARNESRTNGQVPNATEKNANVNLKSKFWAYFWWLFGGIFGAHHIYLRRDEHAVVWFCTLGGYFGLGWLRDLFKIPTYVADVNDQPDYIKWLKYQIRIHKKPPFATLRFVGAVMVSYLFGQLVLIAVPEDEIIGINFKRLIILIPLAVAYGTWLVGNIGREQGSIWPSLIVSYLCYPTLYFIGDESTWLGIMVISSTLSFDSFSKEWRLRRRKIKSSSRRIGFFVMFALVYGGLWSSYFYFNATLTNSEGEEIKLSESIKHLFTSPIWLDLKTCLEETWIQAKHQGFWATWRQLIDLTDPRGEINAYKVLGLSQTASQSEVTAKWRALSREHHPDKVKGTEDERRAAQDKFLEIQQAYEILSSAKNRRQRKNKKSDHSGSETFVSQ
ncbi:dnaJ homolog subfamily C member 22-like [Phymastichus coffea]|uniref:dnaJ homolog subfamily C member 22-like n=1 Tax=Phymastichus coffea TaxID=108790 RepID=UPI00273C028B|nr:dnaJ homolog subfamily C member 22-like [Phymastichus coffea]